MAKDQRDGFGFQKKHILTYNSEDVAGSSFYFYFCFNLKIFNDFRLLYIKLKKNSEFMEKECRCHFSRCCISEMRQIIRDKNINGATLFSTDLTFWTANWKIHCNAYAYLVNWKIVSAIDAYFFRNIMEFTNTLMLECLRTTLSKEDCQFFFCFFFLFFFWNVTKITIK